jgi:hypothetical protein
MPSVDGWVIIWIHIARGPFAASPAGNVDYNKTVIINNINNKVITFIKANLR